MQEEKKSSVVNHKVIMDQRENIHITGVVDVLSFDEESIMTETEMGLLIIKGINLHVNKLSLDTGELNIDGEIESLAYEEQGALPKSKGSLLGKLFK